VSKVHGEAGQRGHAGPGRDRALPAPGRRGGGEDRPAHRGEHTSAQDRPFELFGQIGEATRQVLDVPGRRPHHLSDRPRVAVEVPPSDDGLNVRRQLAPGLAEGLADDLLELFGEEVDGRALGRKDRLPEG
jgi:hypothetical protein